MFHIIFCGEGACPQTPRTRGVVAPNLSQPPTLPAANVYFKTFRNPCELPENDTLCSGIYLYGLYTGVLIPDIESLQKDFTALLGACSFN